MSLSPDRKRIAYVLRKKDGRRALYRVALDGSMTEELVLDNPRVDLMT